MKRLIAVKLLILAGLIVRPAGPSSAQIISPKLPVNPAARPEVECDKEREQARSLAEKGDLPGAVILLREVDAHCPTYESGRDLADAEADAGQYESAKAQVKLLLEQQDRAELHGILGKAETSQKNYKAAALEYQKAAQMDPSETNVFNFGMSLFHLDHNAAITILRYGVKTYPRSIKLHVALGTVLYADGKSLEGAQLLCDAEELDPSDPHPMELLAQTENIPPEVAARVTTLLADLQRRYQHDGLILYDYTMAQSGRWSNSTEIPPHFTQSLEAALRLDPKLSQAYFQLSLVAEQRKQYAEEIRLLQKAIALDAEKEQYHYRLAFAYRKSGNEAKFRDELSRFEKLHGAPPVGQ